MVCQVVQSLPRVDLPTTRTHKHTHKKEERRKEDLRAQWWLASLPCTCLPFLAPKYKKVKLGPVHMRSIFRSPTHSSRSQHGGKAPTFEPQQTIKIRLIITKFGSWFYLKIFTWLVLRVGYGCFLDPTLNTSPKPHLPKMLPYGHLCHTWDPCEPALRLLEHWDFWRKRRRLTACRPRYAWW